MTAASCPDAIDALLTGLQHVYNARDLAEAYPAIRPGRLFRSGSVGRADAADTVALRIGLGVRHFVDFRSHDELVEDTSWSMVLSDGVILTYDTRGRVEQVAVETHPVLARQEPGHGGARGAGAETADGARGAGTETVGGADNSATPTAAPAATADPAAVPDELPECRLHRLALLQRGKFVRGLLPHLPYSTLLSAGWYKLVGNEPAMRGAIVPALNEGGLLLIYKILLETAGAELARTLEILLAAAAEREPALFFCKLGKDRTGTVAALVLGACGASHAEIVRDYARSDGLNEVALGGIEKMEDVRGMDPAIFGSAPAPVMEALLDHIDDTYGGITAYLTAIGFGPQRQHALRRALTEPWDD